MPFGSNVEQFLAAKWRTQNNDIENETNKFQTPLAPQPSSNADFEEPEVSSECAEKPMDEENKISGPGLSKKAPRTGKANYRKKLEEANLRLVKQKGCDEEYQEDAGAGEEMATNESLDHGEEAVVPVRGVTVLPEPYSEEIDKYVISSGLDGGLVGEASNEPRDGCTITELKTVNLDKLGQYEMTGDVWGLLDGPDELNEDEFPGGNADTERVLGNVGSEVVSNIEQEQMEVPKMVIPFGNFGRLLEELDERTQKKNSCTSDVQDKFGANGNQHQGAARNISEVMEKIFGAVADEPATHKPGPATRKKAPAHQNTPRSATPKDGGEATPINGPAIIEANLNKRLKPFKGLSQQQQPYPRSKSMNESYDPLLGPINHEQTPNKQNASTPLLEKESKINEIIPINDFNNVDPLAKTVAYNVVKYFENRKRRHNLKFDGIYVACEATGMEKWMISKIVAEGKRNCPPNGKPIFAKSKPKIPRRAYLEPNVKRDCIARMFIHNSYLIKREVPTLKKIIHNFQENGFEKVGETSSHSVKRRLKKLGFEYSARAGKMKFLIERPEYVAQRFRYLREMQEHRSQKRNIVYVFVVDMLKKGVNNVEWEAWDGEFPETEAGIDMNCVSVLHAASSDGLFQECYQVVEQYVNSAIGLHQEPFINWLKAIFPSLPKGSVVVLGDQRFHKLTDTEPRPHVGCNKEDIANWLRQHNVEVDESLPKALLLEESQRVVLDQKHVLDDEIQALGLIPVQLPPHHRDLNPLSFLWQDVKDKVDKSKAFTTVKILTHFVAKEFTANSTTKLRKAWIQVEKLEKSYYNIDLHTDEELKELIQKYSSELVPINNNTELEKELSSDEEDENTEEPPKKTARLDNP